MTERERVRRLTGELTVPVLRGHVEMKWTEEDPGTALSFGTADGDTWQAASLTSVDCVRLARALLSQAHRMNDKPDMSERLEKGWRALAELFPEVESAELLEDAHAGIPEESDEPAELDMEEAEDEEPEEPSDEELAEHAETVLGPCPICRQNPCQCL